ncbi:kynureninase 2 [Lecanosticta acicola]|uniref:Kynureninase n=1 Tax=Lecanosticta acicola TaxID=111012 RepID=A0AAI8YSY7_9PEZI|nr:kynureninase 2 [Lecanosticta acicola]
MDVNAAIEQLRTGQKPTWPEAANSLDFAQSLDNGTKTFREEFVVPTKAQLKRTSLVDNEETRKPAASETDSSIYFCGNSLGLQPKAISEYLGAYLKTWGSIAVGGHFTDLEDSPLVPYQDMAADCSRKMADIVGAAPEEIVAMNTLTVNLHLMMAAFYRPAGKAKKIMLEWRPFPSDYYAIESQIEWHGLDPSEAMLKVEPDQGYTISTEKILSLIDQHADELALILLPGIQYYSGQLLDIPTITRHAHSRGLTIGWDLAHAAGNVELKLHDWDVDFACWCTYKYMNAGAGSIAGAFIHARHGDSVRNKALKGWYGHDKSSRFLMDNTFRPTPGAQGFQLSNPSIVDLTCLSAALSVFDKTSMAQLRSKSLLLTAYAEFLLDQISSRSTTTTSAEQGSPFEIITPSEPLARGAQLSVLLREGLMEGVSRALEAAGIVCDKRKPGIIRVAPAPLYNTFSEIWRFMQTFEKAVRPAVEQQQQEQQQQQRSQGVEVEARL